MLQAGNVCTLGRCGPNARCDSEDDGDQYECHCIDDYKYLNGVCVPERQVPDDSNSCAGVNCGPNAECDPDTNGNSYECECFDGFYYNANGVCTSRWGASPRPKASPSTRPKPPPAPGKRLQLAVRVRDDLAVCC